MFGKKGGGRAVIEARTDPQPKEIGGGKRGEKMTKT